MNSHHWVQRGKDGGPGIVVALFLALFAGCGMPDAQAWHERWDIRSEELTRISLEADCGRLRTAIEDRVHKMPGGDRAEQLLYSVTVQAAFHRMVRLGCDDAYRP